MAEIVLDPATARVSPLDAMRVVLAASAVPGEVTLGEVPFLAHVGLRGDPADSAFVEAVRNVIGLDLPGACNSARAGEITALWLGTDEWLLVGPDGAAANMSARLEGALAGLRSQVVDLSANRTTLVLEGRRAREVLAKGCGIDFHPRAFGPGRVVQTVLARANVILEQTGDAPAYRIYVRNSFAVYLAAWLLDAMAEYRVPAI
jgi:sarcosine oxidase subunit gamma